MEFDIEDAVGSGALCFSLDGEGVLGVRYRRRLRRAWMARGSPVLFLTCDRVTESLRWTKTVSGRGCGSVVSRGRCVRHELRRIGFEENVMVGFEVDLQRVGWVPPPTGMRCGIVGVFEFDLDGVGRSVVEVFDGVLSGSRQVTEPAGHAPSEGVRRQN